MKRTLCKAIWLVATLVLILTMATHHNDIYVKVLAKYYSLKLEDSSGEARIDIIEALSRLNYEPVVPIIMDEMRIQLRTGIFGSVGLSGLWLEKHTRLAGALSNCWRVALSHLIAAVNDPNESYPLFFSYELARICMRTRGRYCNEYEVHINAPECLRNVCDDPTERPDLRRAAARALTLIKG